MRVRSLLLTIVLVAAVLTLNSPGLAATDPGTLTIGVHVTLVSRWLDLLHQIQKTVAERVLVAPIFQQGFIWGAGSRVEVSGAGLIQGYPYAAPCEDLKLK